MSDNANNTAKYPRPPFVDQPQSPPGLAEEMKPQPDHGELSYVGSGRLAGKRALITGGDSGIGRAVAIAFAREGADVAINYLPEEESDAETVIALIQAEGRKAVAIPGDVRDESFCETLVEQAASELGGLDILVNNAGRQQYCESLEELTTADFDATFKTNVYAAFWITKAALRHLKEHSAIINTSSVQAFKPSPILLDYAQTKACLVAFTKSLAKQLGPKGIRVNAVAPVPTGRCCSQAAASRMRRCVSSAPIRRWGVPGSRWRLRRCTLPLPLMPAPSPPARCGAPTAAMACCKSRAAARPSAVRRRLKTGEVFLR